VKQSNAHHTTNLKHFLAHIFILLVSTATTTCWARRMGGCSDISWPQRRRSQIYKDIYTHYTRSTIKVAY